MKKIKQLIRNIKYLMNNDLSNPTVKLDFRNDKLLGVLARKLSDNP